MSIPLTWLTSDPTLPPPTCLAAGPEVPHRTINKELGHLGTCEPPGQGTPSSPRNNSVVDIFGDKHRVHISPSLVWLAAHGRSTGMGSSGVAPVLAPLTPVPASSRTPISPSSWKRGACSIIIIAYKEV